MKNTLLGFLAIITVTISNPLTLVNNFSKSSMQINPTTTKLNFHSHDEYAEIRRSNEYSHMKADFKDLHWHADNWGLAAVPIYGFVFYGDFVKYYNRVVQSMTEIITKMEELDLTSVKKRTGLETFGAIALGIIGLTSSSEEIKNKFWAEIVPRYKTIVSAVS